MAQTQEQEDKNDEAKTVPTGTIFDIQRFSIHDGPGIRTTVFLKGCPNRCLWCHNPESLAREPELSFTPSLCIGCGKCVEACPHDAHAMNENGEHRFDRARCQRCFACVAVCYAGALETVGREASVKEIMDEVLRDRPFYEQSGGGMTLSGGEPMMQFDFARALLRRAREEGIHTALESSGVAAPERYAEIQPEVDLFLMDWKESDPDRHRDFVGHDNVPVRAALHAIDQAGGAIMLRCPIVPGYNLREDHLRGIAELSNALQHCRGVQVMGYHRLGGGKRARMGLPPDPEPLASLPNMEATALDEVIERLVALGARDVSRS